MKITPIIIALLTAGSLALADNNGPLGFAITQNGHGNYHFQYFQAGNPADTTVALSTGNGGVGMDQPVSGTITNGLTAAQADQGEVKFVVGTNQHGQANSAIIPVTSHFAQAGQ